VEVEIVLCATTELSNKPQMSADYVCKKVTGFKSAKCHTRLVKNPTATYNEIT
jgi:hypothetical protein